MGINSLSQLLEAPRRGRLIVQVIRRRLRAGAGRRQDDKGDLARMKRKKSWSADSVGVFGSCASASRADVHAHRHDRLLR